jgi:hypothetical protein
VPVKAETLSFRTPLEPAFPGTAYRGPRLLARRFREGGNPEKSPAHDGRTWNLFLNDNAGQMKALKLAAPWNDILIGWK